jgi:hypothetical protein
MGPGVRRDDSRFRDHAMTMSKPRCPGLIVAVSALGSSTMPPAVAAFVFRLTPRARRGPPGRTLRADKDHAHADNAHERPTFITTKNSRPRRSQPHQCEQGTPPCAVRSHTLPAGGETSTDSEEVRFLIWFAPWSRLSQYCSATNDLMASIGAAPRMKTPPSPLTVTEKPREIDNIDIASGNDL